MKYTLEELKQLAKTIAQELDGDFLDDIYTSDRANFESQTKIIFDQIKKMDEDFQKWMSILSMEETEWYRGRYLDVFLNESKTVSPLDKVIELREKVKDYADASHTGYPDDDVRNESCEALTSIMVKEIIEATKGDDYWLKVLEINNDL